MHVKCLLNIISAIVLLTGTLVAGAAAYNPGEYSDPAFFSPSWSVPKINVTYTDPDFLSSSWRAPAITTSFSDTAILGRNWTISSPSLMADPSITYRNWSVPNITSIADNRFATRNWTSSTTSTTYITGVYLYYPGTSEPFRLSTDPNLQLPAYDPFSSPGSGWTLTGAMF